MARWTCNIRISSDRSTAERILRNASVQYVRPDGGIALPTGTMPMQIDSLTMSVGPWKRCHTGTDYKKCGGSCGGNCSRECQKKRVAGV